MYSTMRSVPTPPQPLSDLPLPPPLSTSCREYSPSAHLRAISVAQSIQRPASPSAHPGRRGTRFGRAITPPREIKRVRFGSPNVAPHPSRRAYSINVTKESNYSIADSGANISVINPRTADKFQLSPQPWPRPFDIVFGNNTRVKCTHFG